MTRMSSKILLKFGEGAINWDVQKKYEDEEMIWKLENSIKNPFIVNDRWLQKWLYKWD